MTGPGADAPPFRGRAGELRTVRRALDAGEAIVLSGPAGIGKSALARAALAGRSAASGGALSSLWTVPYLPLAQAVRQPLAGDADAVAAQVLERSAGRPLFLEDLQWADPATIDAVGLLVGRLPLLVTVRTTPDRRPDPVVAALAGAPSHELELGPLGARTARALVARRHPTLAAAEVDRLIEAAGGNPLLLEELPVQGSVTPSLQAALGVRLGALSPPARHELLVLALATRPLDGAGLEALARDAVAGAALVRRGDRLEFRHGALAEAVVTHASEAERVAAHRRAAALVDDVLARCHHLLHGHHLARAGRVAEGALADEVDPVRRARLLAVLATARPDPARAVAAGQALLDVGAWNEAVARVDRLDPVDRQRWAEGRLVAGRALWAAGRLAEAASALDDGVAATSPRSPVGVRLRVGAARQDGRRDPGERSVERAAGALAAAQAAGEEQWRARAVLGQALMFCRRPGWADELRTVVSEACAAGDDEAERSAAFALVSGLGFVGDLPEAVRVGRASLRRLEHLPFGTWHAHFAGALVMHEMLMGRDRDDVVARARQLLGARPLFRNRAQVDCALVVALGDGGRFEEAERALRDGLRLARNDEDRSLLCVADAELGWLRRDPARVQGALERARAHAQDWFGVSAIVRALAGYAALDGAGPVADVAPEPGLPVLATLVLEHRALRAWSDGDDGAAVAMLDDAARRWEAVHLTRFAVRARWAAAEVAARHARPDARRRLDHLRSHAPRGLPALSGRITAIAARLTVASAPRLSAREQTVLGLVGEGLTSTAIAERLGIATATVESHVRSARRKLGARTRRQAVATPELPAGRRV